MCACVCACVCVGMGVGFDGIDSVGRWRSATEKAKNKAKDSLDSALPWIHVVIKLMARVVAEVNNRKDKEKSKKLPNLNARGNQVDGTCGGGGQQQKRQRRSKKQPGLNLRGKQVDGMRGGGGELQGVLTPPLWPDCVLEVVDLLHTCTQQAGNRGLLTQVRVHCKCVRVHIKCLRVHIDAHACACVYILMRMQVRACTY